jgi:L-iditol 2-dehydrogenase
MLLRLRVVGLCGTDLFKLRTRTAPVGGVLGHELVGTVIETDAEIIKFRPGDRVVVPHHVACGECIFCRRGSETMCETFRENLLEPGGFADHILVRSRAVRLAAHVIPDDMRDERAVFLEPAACVLRGIERSGLTADGSAVILGAGSMGLLHLLVIRAVFPSASTLVIDLDMERLDLAKRLGASFIAIPEEPGRNAGAALNDGRGADVAFDTVGGLNALRAGMKFTRRGGTIVLFAHAPEDLSGDIDLNALFKSERRLIATYSGSLREQRKIFELLATGALDPSPLVTHKLPLDDFAEGVSLVNERRALKVLFTPSRALLSDDR